MESKLMEKLKTLSHQDKFTYLEWLGFKSNPSLAIQVGIAIGYRESCDDIKNKLSEINSTYEKYTKRLEELLCMVKDLSTDHD